MAVHDLFGDPRSSWVWRTKDGTSSVNWLEDLLPRELSCRVVTFGYDSGPFLDNPQQYFRQVGQHLAFDLEYFRRYVSQ